MCPGTKEACNVIDRFPNPYLICWNSANFLDILKFDNTFYTNYYVNPEATPVAISIDYCSVHYFGIEGAVLR